MYIEYLQHSNSLVWLNRDLLVSIKRLLFAALPVTMENKEILLNFNSFSIVLQDIIIFRTKGMHIWIHIKKIKMLSYEKNTFFQW